ncbi:MAG: hypothetical protein AAF996_02100 [Pseudomonadota bacterium]
MLKRLFSTRSRYRNYAACTALILAVYLVGGFIALKWLFIGAAILPSISISLLIIIGAIAFAAMHITSMKQLDRTNRTSRKDSLP